MLFDPENEEACIHIRIIEKQGSLFIAIEDNGIGLANFMQNRPEEQGTGYGLKILRQTIDILNSGIKNKMNFIIQDRNLLESGKPRNFGFSCCTVKIIHLIYE